MVDVNDQGKLLILPPEILLNICQRLRKRDRKSIRLTSRYLGQLGSELLVDEVIVAANYRRLQVLEEIANHPVFRKHVIRIVFDISTLDCYSMSSAVSQGLLLRSELIGEDDQVVSHPEQNEEGSIAETNPWWLQALESLAETGNIVEAQVPSAICRGIMEGHRNHHQLYEDQAIIRDKEFDLIAFERALNSFPNVTAVILADGDSRASSIKGVNTFGGEKNQLGDNVQGLLAGSADNFYLSPKIGLQAQVLQTISRIGKPLTSFKTSFGSSGGLCTACLDMSAQELRLLCHAFADLGELYLSFCRYRVEDEDEDLRPLKGTNLSQLLQAARQLEHLKLEFDCFGPSALKHIPLGNLIGGERWPNLRSIRLVGMSMHLYELAALIDRQRYTLTEVTLDCIYLSSGGWSQALDLLRQLIHLKKIKLRHLSGDGFSFAQRYRHYSYTDMEQYVLGQGQNPLPPSEPTRFGQSFRAQENFRFRTLQSRINSRFDASVDRNLS
ncbi:MAG: hypothetical protein M1835_006577 [Candelina submexicana]|nr:MAG: hypothetical protein M1835_006577 [Candelina submexicana]